MCTSRAYGRSSATPASSFAPFAASATTSSGTSVGRLFWKIFIGFWIALVVAAVGAGTAVWVQHHSHDAPPQDLAAGPPSRIVIDLAAATLRHGRVEALPPWMSEVQSRRAMVMFAVDAQGRDVLGPGAPSGALTAAREIIARGEEGRGARQVSSPPRASYLPFLPRGPGPRGQRPPPEPP